MHVELSYLGTDETVIVTYNDEELLTIRCPRFHSPTFDIQTPKVSGCARVFLVRDGKREQVSEGRYYFDDVEGAKMRLAAIWLWGSLPRRTRS